MTATPPHTNPFLSRVMKRLRVDAPQVPAHQSFSVRLDRAAGGVFAQVWFLTRGCTWDRGGACTMCNYGRGPRVTGADMVRAVDAALHSLPDDIDELFVSPSGSMLDPAEVPPDARLEIFRRMAASNASKICVETRAETVTAQTAQELTAAFDGRRVTVELGLESASAWIQRFCINRMSHPSVFTDASALLRRHGIRVSANIALGTAFLTEPEAARDAKRTLRWALDHGADLAVVFPMHVKPYTLLAWLHERGDYEPPSLWSLADVLASVVPDDLPRVTISWYRSNYAPSAGRRVAPTTCPHCRDLALSRLDAFRESPGPSTVSSLMSLQCDCRDTWKALQSHVSSEPLPERVWRSYAMLSDALGFEEWWSLNGTSVRRELHARWSDDVRDMH